MGAQQGNIFFCRIKVRMKKKLAGFGLRAMGIKHLPPLNYFKKRVFKKAIFPHFVCFAVTRQCNLHCLICPPFGTNKTVPEKELSTEAVKEVIDQLASLPAKPYVSITGGEPFLRSDIADILVHLTLRRMPFGILSNATLINASIIGRLRSVNPALCQISLDGPERVHNRIRQSDKAFSETLEAVRLLKEGTNWKIMLLCVINSLNAPYLNEVAQIADAMGIDVCFEHLGFITEPRMRLQQKVAGSYSGTNQNVEMNENSYRLARLDVKVLLNQIRRLRSRKGRIRVFFSPRIPGEKLESYYSDSDEPVVSDRCFFPWFAAKIDPYGNVFACRMNYLPLGSILYESLTQLYNNGKSVIFRRGLTKQLMPACARCPWCGSGDLLVSEF